MIAGLPYDAEVEYLESTGTQWIDTGYDFYTTDSPAEEKYIKWVSKLGSMDATGYYLHGAAAVGFWGVYNGYWRMWGNTTQIAYTAGTMQEIEAVFSPTEVSMAIDGSVVGRYGGSPGHQSPQRNCLFAYTGGGFIGSWKIGKTLLFKGVGNLVRDFIPVRFTNEQNQSEGAMYDRVSRKLFRNAGTGSFTIGPDVATPVMGLHFFKSQIKTAKDYVQNGLVAMWDGIENAGWGVHDPNATTWKNLVTGSDSPLVGNAMFSESCLVCDTQSDGCTIGTWDYQTIEVVCTRRGGLYTVATPYSQVNNIRNVIFVPNVGYCGNNYGKVVSFDNYQSPHNVAFTFGDEYLAYGDGVLSTSGNYNDWWTIATGVINYVAGGLVSRAGIGDYYAVRLYSRDLTAAEIAANYAVDKERFNLP